MSTQPLTSPSSKPIRLAKVATLLAVIFGITFGLCTVTAIAGGVKAQNVLSVVITTSAVIELVCLVGVVGSSHCGNRSGSQQKNSELSEDIHGGTYPTLSVL